ncbi:MAG: hypothetical protein HY661_03735 [Betaproteobacteria bacterium]|nr:hypothetical protein [Betaproteobacteria bacterium]
MAMIGGRRSYLYYGCAYHQSRGRTICSNGLHVRTVEADALVIEKIRGVLTPAAFDYTIDQALKLRALHALEARDAQRREQADTPERLEAEARKLRRELDRFMALIAGGTAPASIMAEINRREARLAAIEVERARLVAVDDEGPLELDVRRMRKGFRERLVDLHGLLKSDIPLARQALRKLLADRISFRPVERNGARGYDLSWKIVTGALLSDSYISLASPRGFEPRLPP